MSDGSYVRLRAERPNHAWSYDFVHDRNHDGRDYRTLNIIDEYAREALMIRVDRKLNWCRRCTDRLIHPAWATGINTVWQRSWFHCQEGMWLDHGRGCPKGLHWTWITMKNGCCESFNARFRDQLLSGEIFCTLREAQILIERWRHHYNTVSPHSALGYCPPAPESIITVDQNYYVLTFNMDHSMGACHAHLCIPISSCQSSLSLINN